MFKPLAKGGPKPSYSIIQDAKKSRQPLATG